MTEKTLDLERDAHLLSGKERARLLLKDAHQRQFGNKKGFLTKLKINVLSSMPDHKTKKEYEYYLRLLNKVPLIMGSVTEAFLRFKYFYSKMETINSSYNLILVIHELSKLLEELDEKTGDQRIGKIIIKMAKIINRLRNEMEFKDIFDSIKELIPKINYQVCYFFSMKRIVERVNKELDFNVFAGRLYNETYQGYIKEINLCIREHNRIMREIGKDKDIKKLEDYLIAKPTFKTKTYKEWAEMLFKERPSRKQLLEILRGD
ncbi:hypothetical protein ES708_27184 [subsurface metagenome]